jgi:hypothetical protein
MDNIVFLNLRYLPMCPLLPSILKLPHHLLFLVLVAWTSSAVAQNPSLSAVVDKKVLALCMVAARICSSVGLSSTWHMEALCKWDARFLLTSVEEDDVFW